MQTTNLPLQAFKNQVGIKFQLYNSLFGSLPFHTVEKTGILTSMLLVNCEEGYQQKKSPVEIIEHFFAKQYDQANEEEKIDLLFRFVQYIERQVVLFDALEDAGFAKINDLAGKGTIKQLSLDVEAQQKKEAFKNKLKDFSIQLVLTAHPTQFYTGSVLGIIHDLSSAINNNNETQIYTYLQQLGRTPFFQKQKPTPYDEAISLVWYLENVFYEAAGRIVSFLYNKYGEAINAEHPIIKMGFWPGGDRDGNPFVTAAITQKVAEALRGSILKSYYLDVRKLKRRLTFKSVDTMIADLEKRIYDNLFLSNPLNDLSQADILKTLRKIHHLLVEENNGLFVGLVENLINKVSLFGLHFATLDIRQDSRIHHQAMQTIAEKTTLLPKDYSTLSEPAQIAALEKISPSFLDPNILEDAVQKDILEVMAAMKNIQIQNGEAGCNRYIISQCTSAVNLMEVYTFFLFSGWQPDNLSVDIIPLFETIDDLSNAASIMETLYQIPAYKAHLERRKNKQTIMLGFSDGTKDGGYLMANWSIYKAKQTLTAISLQYGVDVVFFDGRGGPPARGGGKTHNFYASLGKSISNKEIQLTIQGQTVSSNFGTIDSAQFNIEQLLNAGISNDIFDHKNQGGLSKNQCDIIEFLAIEGFNAYTHLKNQEKFTNYLLHVSPLRFYADTNIGSRPAKRGGTAKFELKDLRAIPFVGSWSQIKQNVTGFYGVGSSLQKAEEAGKWAEVADLYNQSLFFRTLMDNCEMAMKKCFFPLTAYIANHPEYGQLWNLMFAEYNRTAHYLSKLNHNKNLMDNYPIEQLSINMREKIVLPLLTIQQYAIHKIRQMEENNLDSPYKKNYEKLIMRCSFGIINASRNSA